MLLIPWAIPDVVNALSEVAVASSVWSNERSAQMGGIIDQYVPG